MTDRDGVLKMLEGRTSTLFLAAGGLFMVFAALHGIEAFLGRSAPKDVFGPAGFAIAFTGMLGLYPSLADRSPGLTRTGALFATLGLLAAAVTSVWHIGLWVFPAVTPAYVTGFSLGMLLGQFGGYTSFGLASLRANIHSRALGVLLVSVPTILAVMIVIVATGYATSRSAVVLGSVQALVHLAIGFILRVDRGPTDNAEPSVVGG